MSNKKKPHARKLYNAASDEASASEPADPESGGYTEPTADHIGHVVTLDETLTDAKGSGQRDAEKPTRLDTIAFPPKELERLQRIMSAPWLQSYAASNMPLANMTNSLGILADLDVLKPHISRQLLESVNRALKVTTPDVSQVHKVLGDALLPLSQMQLQQNMSLKPISDALTKLIETSLRHATLAGFAKRTQEWLTTTETLRYRSNNFVWHYTNGYAFLSIIKSGNLWASSPESLNDASEMTHGLTLIREIERGLLHIRFQST